MNHPVWHFILEANIGGSLLDVNRVQGVWSRVHVPNAERAWGVSRQATLKHRTMNRRLRKYVASAVWKYDHGDKSMVYFDGAEWRCWASEMTQLLNVISFLWSVA